MKDALTLPRRPRIARDPATPAVLTDAEHAVLAALRDMRYGQVEVTVHSTRIVQITRSEKLRVDDR